MQIIEGVIRAYDWGSTTELADLLGLPATGEPMAELWLGAHPSAPARVGPAGVPLDRVVADDPVGALGPHRARFGELPFLLKVLTAARPLSLQAHPSSAQAEAGFAREEAAGVPRDAPERSFRDRSHKPELICALSRFDALCGFRDPLESLEVLASIETPALDPVAAVLGRAPDADGLGHALEWLLTLDRAAAVSIVEPVVEACRSADPGRAGDVHRLVAGLGDRYPGDIGVVVALLLNPVTLEPGEALFLGAGNLHTYLRGAAVEVMANSDNVLRGGLTSKHVDTDALLDVVEARPMTPEIQRPAVVDGVVRYASPAEEFALSRVELDGTATLDTGPAILLCTAGAATCGPHVLDRGTAMWVPAVDGPVELQGRATVFRAGIGPSAGPTVPV